MIDKKRFSLRNVWASSIRNQLVIAIVLVHAVLMLLFVFDLVERQRTFLHEQSLEQSISLTETIAANSVSWVLANDYVGLEEIIHSVSKYPGIRYAMVLSEDGRVLAHNDSAVVGKFINDDRSVNLLSMTPEVHVLANNTRLQDVAVPIFSNQQRIGWARVGISVESTMASLNVITRNGIIYIFVAILIGAAIAMFMANSITSGLKSIVNVSSKIRDGDSTQRVLTKREDELGELAKDFNHMLDALEVQKQAKEKAWNELEEHRDHLEELVSERTKALETAMDEALQAARAKSEFLATMSHELRTPLNSIIGFTTIVKDGMAGEINDVQKSQLETVSTSARHLLNIINEVLDLSKVESGKMGVNKTTIDVNEFFTELRGVLLPLALDKGLDLVVEPCDETIVSDRAKLLQIMINLAGNAVKFTEKGSVQVSCVPSEKTIEFRVSDTGIGVAVDQQQRIFEAFSQADSGDDRDYGGTGLGLTITKRFTELLGGTVQLESELGKGSTFIVKLPHH